MGARKENSRPSGARFNKENDRLDAFPKPESFSRNLLLRRKNPYAVAKIDEYVPSFDSLDDSRNEFSFFVFIFFECRLAFRFADSLDDNLFCGLRRDTAEIGMRVKRKFQLVPGFCVFLYFFCLVNHEVFFWVETDFFLNFPFSYHRKIVIIFIFFSFSSAPILRPFFCRFGL